VTLALFDSALVLQRATKDRSEVAITLLWRAFLHIMLFDHAAARSDLAEGIAESEASANPFTLAWAVRHQGHLEWHTGELAEASGHLAAAVTRLSAIGDSFGLNTVRDIQNGVALDRNDLVTAEMLLRDNLSSAVSAGFSTQVFSSLNGLAQVAMRQGRWVEADARLKETVTFGRRHGLAFWLEGIRYDEAVVALRLGRLDEAERLLRHYLASSVAGQSLDRYSARSRLAELHLLRGNAAAAEVELTAATDELEALRRSLGHRGLRVYLFQTHRGYDDPDAGFANIVAGLVAAGRVAPAFALAERRRARHLADRLLPPGQRDDPTAEPALPLVQDGRTAFVEYLTGRGAPTTVFIRTREKLMARVLPPADTLALSMKRTVALLESGADLSNHGVVLRRTWLDPVLEELPPAVHRLIFALDGPLHHLPLEALPLESGAALLTRYTVSIVPSAATAERLAGQKARAVVPGAVLAFGDPAFAEEKTSGQYGIAELYRSGFEEAGGLVRLRGSAREVRRVARFSPSAVIRVRGQASESFLKHAALDSFQVIHFATHALVNEQSAVRTSLALAPGEGEDGFLGTDEIADLRLGADLVVLSGCGTAGGEVVGGEGILGLTGPLLGSGARAVVATMWRIGDESAIVLVELLYRGLANGLPVGEALQQAKLEALRRGMPAREWAAFVLIGDPLVTVQLQPPSNRYLWMAVSTLGLLAIMSYGLVNWKRRTSEVSSTPVSSSTRTHQL
jgi:CHAT domain-containing protein